MGNGQRREFRKVRARVATYISKVRREHTTSCCNGNCSNQPTSLWMRLFITFAALEVREVRKKGRKKRMNGMNEKY